MSLTKAEERTLGVITQFIDENGYPPTIREIAALSSIRSCSTAHKHVMGLRDKGYIEWTEGSQRTIRILK